MGESKRFARVCVGGKGKYRSFLEHVEQLTHMPTRSVDIPSGDAGLPLPSPAKDCRGVPLSLAFATAMAASKRALGGGRGRWTVGEHTGHA